MIIVAVLLLLVVIAVLITYRIAFYSRVRGRKENIYDIPFHVFIDKAYLRKITFTNIEANTESYADFYPFPITWKDEWCDGTV